MLLFLHGEIGDVARPRPVDAQTDLGIMSA